MKQLFIKTDKKFIAGLPRFKYEGRIVVIQSEAEAERAVAALENSKILGIDTEPRPSFRKGVFHQVALLQIATEDICFLFRLNSFGFISSLRKLLANKEILKVGLSLKDDIHMLAQRHAFVPGQFLDLQDYVKEMGIQDMSLQKIFANVFHQRISKSAQLSNWEADILSPAQKTYAATDAYSCIMLYNELKHLRETGFTLLKPQPAAETLQ